MEEIFGEGIETDGEETPKLSSMKKSKSVTFQTTNEINLDFSLSPRPSDEPGKFLF